MPINYQEGKIYKIFNIIDDDIYVGSTTRKLSERMAEHRNDYKINRRFNTHIYKAFREHGVENFFIELIEKCPCNDKDELRKKEGEYIRTLKPSLNMRIAGRTKLEYHNDNKEHLLQLMKKYNENNKEHIIENNKQYRENNKEYIIEKITCECGCIVTRANLPKHKRSAKHQKLMTE